MDFSSVLVLLFGYFTAVINSVVYLDVCQSESKVLQCPRPDQVMLTLAAEYGQPEHSKCVRSGDVTRTSCYSDVTSELDVWCSGRSVCLVDEGLGNLYSYHPCSSDWANHIHLAYVCLDVAVAPMPQCTRHGEPLTLPSGEGIMSSYIRDISGCGSDVAPWVVVAPSGERVTLSILDFGWSADFAGRGCVWEYGTIQERGDAESAVVFCSGIKRQRGLYQSRTNAVTVALADSRMNSRPQFLIQYRVLAVNMKRYRSGSKPVAVSTTALLSLLILGKFLSLC